MAIAVVGGKAKSHRELLSSEEKIPILLLFPLLAILIGGIIILIVTLPGLVQSTDTEGEMESMLLAKLQSNLVIQSTTTTVTTTTTESLLCPYNILFQQTQKQNSRLTRTRLNGGKAAVNNKQQSPSRKYHYITGLSATGSDWLHEQMNGFCKLENENKNSETSDLPFMWIGDGKRQDLIDVQDCYTQKCLIYVIVVVKDPVTWIKSQLKFSLGASQEVLAHELAVRWNSFYGSYFSNNTSSPPEVFPHTMVESLAFHTRYEDLLVDSEGTASKVCTCAGGSRFIENSLSFAPYIKSIQFNLLRYQGLEHKVVEVLAATLDPYLLQLFNYEL